VRRMLMMQDRAAIAKGLKEGCSLRRIADRIVWIGFSGVSGGYTVTAGSAGISPCGSRCEHASETPDPDRQGPAGFDAASGPLRFRVQDRFWECSRDTPATFAAGTPGVEAGDSKSRESVQGLPK